MSELNDSYLKLAVEFIGAAVTGAAATVLSMGKLFVSRREFDSTFSALEKTSEALHAADFAKINTLLETGAASMEEIKQSLKTQAGDLNTLKIHKEVAAAALASLDAKLERLCNNTDSGPWNHRQKG